MRKLLFALSILTVSVQSQNQHRCAEAKIKNSTNKVSGMLASNPLVNLEDQYDLKFYHLNLNLSIANKSVSGSVRCLATVSSSALDSFAFELYNTYTIDSVILNGLNTPVTRKADEARVAFATSLTQGGGISPLAQGSLIDATVYYHGTAPTINGPQTGDGYNNSTSQQYGNTSSFSLSECYHAYEWFPCKQQLVDKIDSSWVFVTTDSANKVGSNGLLKNVVVLGKQKRYEWKNIHPIDYYLISVALAQYTDYSLYAHPQGYPDSVLIQHYIYNNPQYLSDYKSVLDSTKQLVELFSKLYGIYPWADQKYGHCITGLGGGMEHQTMTSMEEYLDLDLVAHELGHQWFGDYVTCRTWHDIMMNEGFATYTEYLAYEYLEPPSAAPFMLQAHSYIMSQPDGSVYNPDTTSENRIFDSRLSYDKGAAILHTLRFVLNDDSVFFQAYKNYLQQFKYGTGSINDFKQSVATTSGLNLDQFFTQWVYGEGYPTFNVHWNQQGNNFAMRSIQTVSDASVTPLYITPIQYTLQRSIGDTIIRVMHNSDTAFYYFSVSGTVTGIVVDPANWIINKVIGPTHDNALATGIAEYTHMAGEIHVYPNPAHTRITVKSEGVFDFELYDLSGNLLLGKKCNASESFDVSAFSAGMYFYRVKPLNKEGITTGKLIVE